MAVTSQYPQFMLVSAGSDKIATDDETPNNPSLLQVPKVTTLPPESEQFEKNQRRLSTASSLRTIETNSDTTTCSSTSLSTTSSAASFKSSTSLSSYHFADPGPQDEFEDKDQLRVNPRSTYEDSRLAVGLRGRENQSTIVIRKACRYDCHCKCHDPKPISPRRKISMFKTSRSRCTEPTCQVNASLEEAYSDNSSRFRRALSHVMTSRSIQYRYNLNTYRMIPEGSDVMRYVKHGNLDKLKGCIESGEATIWDTAPDGWSLLHVSGSSAVIMSSNTIKDSFI